MMPDPTPDTRATVELLRICELTREQIAPLEPDTGFIGRIIRDLRRLVDLEMEAQADDAQIAALTKEVEMWRGSPGVSEELLQEMQADRDAALKRLVALEAENARLKADNQKLSDMVFKCADAALAHREGQ